MNFYSLKRTSKKRKSFPKVSMIFIFSKNYLNHLFRKFCNSVGHIPAIVHLQALEKSTNLHDSTVNSTGIHQ